MAALNQRVGLVPAAGHARRLGGLPCSKEIYPVGWKPSATDSSLNLRVASHSLFEQMQQAGANAIYVVLREGKWDIPAYWGDGHQVGVPIAYLMVHDSYGVPFTLDQGHPFVEGATVLFGLPDIVIQTEESLFPPMLRRLDSTGADVVLGLFVPPRPEAADMVRLGPETRVGRVEVKPEATSLTHAWVCAVWSPAFTTFLHEVVGNAREAWTCETPELHLGHVFQKGIEAGLHIEGYKLSGTYTDVGTPEALNEI